MTTKTSSEILFCTLKRYFYGRPSSGICRNLNLSVLFSSPHLRWLTPRCNYARHLLIRVGRRHSLLHYRYIMTSSLPSWIKKHHPRLVLHKQRLAPRGPSSPYCPRLEVSRISAFPANNNCLVALSTYRPILLILLSSLSAPNLGAQLTADDFLSAVK